MFSSFWLRPRTLLSKGQFVLAVSVVQFIMYFTDRNEQLHYYIVRWFTYKTMEEFKPYGNPKQTPNQSNPDRTLSKHTSI